MTTVLQADAPRPTRNDTFKRRSSSRTGFSFLLAVGFHVALFALWPTMRVQAYAQPDTNLRVVPVEEYDLPEAPQPPTRPAAPIAATADLPEDVTIAPTVWDEYRPEELPPPPPEASTRSAALPFTPHTVKPSLKNPNEVMATLEREYPTILKEAGIGGTVVLHVHVGTHGEVLDAKVGVASGHRTLDDAALTVAKALRFNPALNRERRVALWIALPIQFRSGGSRRPPSG